MPKTYQILLVEDNLGDVRIAKEAFKSSELKINLSFVTDGEEALNYLRNKNSVRPDLILLDLNLPKIDGREVLSNIKNDINLKQIPIIVLTTSDSQEDINNCYSLGANSYITKPIELEDFFSTIKLIEQYWLSTVKLPENKSTF